MQASVEVHDHLDLIALLGVAYPSQPFGVLAVVRVAAVLIALMALVGVAVLERPRLARLEACEVVNHAEPPTEAWCGSSTLEAVGA